MGLFDKLKGKKPKTMDLPPPPAPIHHDDFPELPDIEAPPAPEMNSSSAKVPAPQEHTAPEPMTPLPRPMDAAHVEPAPRPEHPTMRQVQRIPEPPSLKVPTREEPVAERRVLPSRQVVSPLFVSTNDYQAILDGITNVRKTLGDSENILAQLTKIKNQEEKVFSDWKQQMEDIERKLTYVDSVIASSQEGAS